MKTHEFLNLRKLNDPVMQELRQAVDRVVTSGRYVGGPEVERFEQALCEFQKAPFAIGVSNGLDALRLIMEGYKQLGLLHEGDEIIVPANTYIATTLAISHAGLTPVPVEPDIRTLNMDPTLAEQAVTPRTKAIMAVNLYGRVAFDTRLKETVQRHRLLLFEDNAQAIGAVSSTTGLFGSDISGALGNAGAFSFYPTKNIGALGDAGAVVTHNAELAAAVRTLANYGSDRRYHNIYQGFNCRLDPIQAAVLSVKLKYAARESSHRQELARIYHSAITNPLIVKPEIPADPREHVWHQYVILSPERDALQQHLMRNGIGTDIHYATPPHMQPCYSDTFAGTSFPVTEKIARECLSLPISSCTSPDDAARIAAVINNWNA